ncbi:hypothetical protein BACEGG_01579 [Bacteroides eggerthii DSM 20697]|nr:hypothetical protein BACEGG_01579 [Bacteroides eggerthii DSM 20697]
MHNTKLATIFFMSVYNLKIRGAKIEIIQHNKQYFQFPINKKAKKSYNLNKNVFIHIE